MARKRFYKYSTEEDYQNDVDSLPIPHIAKVADDIKFKTELDEPCVECVFDCNRGTNQILSDDSHFKIDTMSKMYVNGKLLDEPVKTIDVGYNCKYIVRTYFISSAMSSYIFKNCNNLVSVVIPDNVVSVGAAAFNGCTELTSINIGKNVTNSVYGETLHDCTKLEFIHVSKYNPVYKVVDGVLIDKKKNILCKYPAGKSDISYTIPDEIKEIALYAFADCKNLLSINFNKNVTRVGISFDNCNITKVNFASIESLCNISFVTTYISRSNPLYTAGNLHINGELMENVVIPEGVTKINRGVFAYSNIKSVLIPNSVTSIDELAFYHSSLALVNIPNSVTNIKVQAFLYTNLTSVTIPNSVMSIEKYTFLDCSNLTSAIIPDSVTSIHEFAFSGCSSLTSVDYSGTVKQWNAISKGSAWKSNVPKTCIIHCIDGNIPITES